MWTEFVHWFYGLLFSLAHVYGGNMGLAIITLSMIVRLCLLPLNIKLGRLALIQQLLMKKLQP
jgi:YidC/Oxa1 family membrane protein insertase